MYAVFLVKPQDNSIIEALRSDDLVGRQSLLVRDAAALDLKEQAIVLLIEGSDEAISKSRKIGGEKLGEVAKKRSEVLYRKIKDEESKADQGMGFLFG